MLPTLTEAQAKLRAGELSSRELVTSVLDAIDKTDSTVGAYVHVDADTALAAADKADPSLPLGGLPIALKDVINVEGQPCSCGSQILHGKYTSPYDATVTKQLKEAGAILLGRTNTSLGGAKLLQRATHRFLELDFALETSLEATPSLLKIFVIVEVSSEGSCQVVQLTFVFFSNISYGNSCCVFLVD